jgi:plastocyanin
MKYVAVIAGIIILGIVAGGAWLLATNKDANDQPSATRQADTKDSTANEDETEETEPSVVITYTETGFRLSGNTIQAGDTVLVVNESSDELAFASDPHPQHTDNQELNVPTLTTGEQETFVITEPGAWGFHNHLNDGHSGTITVIN